MAVIAMVNTRPLSSHHVGRITKAYILNKLYFFKLQMKWYLIHLPSFYSLTNSLTQSLTHSVTHSLICPHNALVSHLKLVPGLLACLITTNTILKGYVCICLWGRLGIGRATLSSPPSIELTTQSKNWNFQQVNSREKNLS